MSDPIQSTTSTDQKIPNVPASDPGVDLIASILNEQNQSFDAASSQTVPPITTTQPPLPDGAPSPMAVLVKKPNTPPPPGSPKKSRGVSVLIAGILVLLLSLPLVVSFMNQKKQTTDVRSKASVGPYPPGYNECLYYGDPGIDCNLYLTPTAIPGPTKPPGTQCNINNPTQCLIDCGSNGVTQDSKGMRCSGDTPKPTIYPPGYTQCLVSSANPDRDCNWMLLGPDKLKDYAQCILLYSEDTCGKLYGPKITPIIPGKIIAWQQCSPTGAVQEAECMDGQTSTRYICQGDKGWQPDLTSICSKPYCAWPRDNPNAPCCPPKNGVDSCNPADRGGTDLYKCIPDPFISKCTWIEGCGGGYWKAEGWTDTADAKTNPVWADFEKKCGITITPPPKITPAPTLPPGSTGTPPPGGGTNPPPGGETPTPTLAGGQCTRIKIYKGNIEVTPSTLKAGDAVILAVAGANASKGRIRVNGGSWNESSTLNAQNEYTVAFTIPANTINFSVEAEVLVNGAWK